MQFRSDIFLKHPNWRLVENLLEKSGTIGLFERLIDLFLIAAAIGIKADKTVANESTSEDDNRSIGRNTLQNNPEVSELMDTLYTIAVFNTKTIDLDMKQRMKLAFNPDENELSSLNPTVFLVPFANYGLNQIVENLTNHDIESIDRILSMLNGLIEGRIEDLSDQFIDNI